METPSPRTSLFERLSALFSREPEDREELLELLHSAHERNLVDADVLQETRRLYEWVLEPLYSLRR